MILTAHHRLQAISYHSEEVYKATRVIIVIHTTQATAHVQNLFSGFVKSTILLMMICQCELLRSKKRNGYAVDD